MKEGPRSTMLRPKYSRLDDGMMRAVSAFSSDIPSSHNYWSSQIDTLWLAYARTGYLLFFIYFDICDKFGKKLLCISL